MMRVWKTLLVLAVLGISLAAAALLVRVEYAPFPSEAELLNPQRRPFDTAYDVLGERVPHADVPQLKATRAGLAHLSRENGAIQVTPALVQLGRDAFYRETFGNEVFLSDVMGLLDGAMTPWAMTKSLLSLAGGSTTNLELTLARDVRLGDRVLAKGTVVPTGLDVPAGSLLPLGVKMVWDKGRLRAGLTCAACHSTVDAATGKVVEGVPNTDLNVGLMLALASNTSAYFTHVGVKDPTALAGPDAATVTARDGQPVPLPDPAALEALVDGQFAAWPPGSFDSTIDKVNNPTSIPDSFTAEAHPYGWSGFALVGPFRGSSMLSNNVHALNADATTSAQAAPDVLGLDTEVYLALLLRGAANPDFRWDPAGGAPPSAVLAAADPTPESPALVSAARMPTFPKVTYVSTDSLLLSTPGLPVWEKVNAMSAFQETLTAPLPPLDPQAVQRGARVFDRAGCGACHAGPALTNNRILPVAEVGTEPSRAIALAATEKALAPSLMIAPSAPFPMPAEPRVIDVPIPTEQLDQLALGWAHRGTQGGYKVKGLVGLAWTAPYLHDSGVAVGPDADRQLGLPGTLYAGVTPDPRNSLRALLDRDLRAKVVAANRADARAQTTHATGEGHPFWADAAAGFSPAEQEDLVSFLLSIRQAAPR
ncbi:hypothetical protein [Aerophototrophica crusticola]